VVHLSVVCHTDAPCLNHSVDLHATWQVCLWSPMRHGVRWESLAPRGRVDLGSNPLAKTWNCKSQPNGQSCMLASGVYKQGVSDSALFQITLVLVIVVIITRACILHLVEDSVDKALLESVEDKQRNKTNERSARQQQPRLVANSLQHVRCMHVQGAS